MIDYEKAKEVRNLKTGFINNIGLVVTEMGPGYAVGEITLTEFHANPIGTIHGGVLFAIADTIGGAATPAGGSWVTTVNGDIHFLNAANIGDKLIVESKAVKLGHQLAVVDIMIRTAEEKDIACATITYHYLGDKMPMPQIGEEEEETNG